MCLCVEREQVSQSGFLDAPASGRTQSHLDDLNDQEVPRAREEDGAVCLSACNSRMRTKLDKAQGDCWGPSPPRGGHGHEWDWRIHGRFGITVAAAEIDILKQLFSFNAHKLYGMSLFREKRGSGV